MSHPNALIIFAKNPVYGKVKTRLAATIGEEAALNVYKHLLERCRLITEKLSADKFVFYSDHVPPDDIWDAAYIRSKQEGHNLGERMQNAFQEVFDEGYKKVVIIGTDCPSLTEEIIEEAFNKLEQLDVVIGPAKDGGYYLLGMISIQPELFKRITWSTEEVLQQTLNACNHSTLTTYLLPELSDLDDENDLKNSSNYLLTLKES